MIKTFISTLIISIGITQYTVAFGSNGGVDGGGGKGIVCKNSTGAISSVELLDLWEARTLYSENISPTIPSLGLKNGVYAVLNVLKNAYPFKGWSQKPGCKDQECIFQNLQQRADLFLNDSPKIKRLHGETLELTDDSYEIAKPSGCDIAQIMALRGKLGRI